MFGERDEKKAWIFMTISSTSNNEETIYISI